MKDKKTAGTKVPRFRLFSPINAELRRDVLGIVDSTKQSPRKRRMMQKVMRELERGDEKMKQEEGMSEEQRRRTVREQHHIKRRYRWFF